jgi:UDP-N-acetylmuramate dehydrogenase
MNPPAKIAIEKDIEIIEDVDLTKHNSMRIPAKARYLAVVNSIDGIHESMELAQEQGLDWYLLGGGSNVIFAEDMVDAVFIKLGRGFKYLSRIGDSTIITGAATPLNRLVRFAKDNSLRGFEKLNGIPGTVGGAVAGNAGTSGYSICQCIKEATVLEPHGKVRIVKNADIRYSYRYCELAESIILETTFAIEKGIKAEIEWEMEQVCKLRAGQPHWREEPSAGCIFKNPKGDSAGRLIDAAGLKDTQVGGAAVSEKHANFIVNRGGATPDDVVEILNIIRARVNACFGVTLETEIKIFGRNRLLQGV